MADRMQPTPRGYISGLFSDAVNLPLQYMSSPERTQQMQGMAQLLYGTGIPKTLERISYGDSLFSGAGMTLRPKEETINAAMNVAPFAPVAGRVAGRMIKATEGMPVGMSIKDVGKNIFEDATKYHQKVPEIRTINVNNLKRMNSGEVADVSDEVAAKMDFSKPIQVSVFADGELRIVDGHHRVAAAKKLGIQSLPVELQAINAKGATLNKLAQEATYPQQAALNLAQQRAALPVEQGGLGLLANNTAADRAKAMGFESGYVHGSPNPDITNLRPSITGAQGEGIYATNYLPESNMYSGTKEGATNYPLYVNTQKALDVGEANPYDVLGFDLQSQLAQRQKDAIISRQKETEDWLIKNGVPFMPSREHYVSILPENLRSRFAAFDPFRKDVATATAMGVALPDLLAQPVNEYQNPYETLPMYTDPFGNTIGSSIR